MANRREKNKDREYTMQTSSSQKNHNRAKKFKKANSIRETNAKNILVPLYVFQTKLSPFEAIVKYLVEERNLGFTEIAKITNRSPKTILRK